MKIYDYNGKKNICGERLREARVIQRLRQEDLAAKSKQWVPIWNEIA